MNMQYFDGELVIYLDDDFPSGEENNEIMHMWQNTKTKMVFIIGKDCEMTSEEIEGHMHYSIERKSGKDGVQ